MKRWLVLLAACGGTTPTPVKTDPPPTTTSVAVAPTPAKKRPPPEHCPPLSYNNVGFWRSEIFPACPDEPLVGFPVCGDDCEYPCKVTSNVGGSVSERANTYTNGMWVSTQRIGRGSPEMSCHYQDNIRTDCELYGDAWVAKRDAEGRVVEVKGTNHRSEIKYDAKGRVIHVDGQNLKYDGDGQMVVFGDLELEWRDRKVVTERSPDRIASYEYDKQGRTTRIVYDEAGRTRELTVTYSGARVLGWKSDNVELTYGYDCSTPP